MSSIQSYTKALLGNQPPDPDDFEEEEISYVRALCAIEKHRAIVEVELSKVYGLSEIFRQISIILIMKL